MAKNKTTTTTANINDFIDSVADEKKRRDSLDLLELIRSETGLEPVMWGTAIIGFGSYHYTYESGLEGDAPLIGFSPRKDSISLYLASTFDRKEALLKELGRHKAGKGCIYIKKMEDIKIEPLKEMIRNSVSQIKSRYPSKDIK